MSDITPPKDIQSINLDVAQTKATSSLVKLAILGFLAGAFIAFAAEASNMAAFSLLAKPATYGLGRFVAGVVFPAGLMLVVIAGAELFTGNTLMIAAVYEKKITIGQLLRNWIIVYIFNLVGSVFMAFLIVYSGQLNAGGGELAGITIKIAAGKVGLSFTSALLLGIGCNWLVCLAVWMAYATKSLAGKILAIFFPIMLFITSGFEHCVANMYYIPAGMLASMNPTYVENAMAIGVSAEAMDALTMQGFFVSNLLPVTIGNIIGGSIFVASAYFLAYRNKAHKQIDIETQAK